MNIFYNMNTIRGNQIFEKNYISDLSEFTPEERKQLLEGEEVLVYEKDEENGIMEDEYTSIYEENL